MLCFVCHEPTKKLDMVPVKNAYGTGWMRREWQILTECESCGTQSLRTREVSEWDEGQHPKRSLR